MPKNKLLLSLLWILIGTAISLIIAQIISYFILVSLPYLSLNPSFFDVHLVTFLFFALFLFIPQFFIFAVSGVLIIASAASTLGIAIFSKAVVKRKINTWLILICSFFLLIFIHTIIFITQGNDAVQSFFPPIH